MAVNARSSGKNCCRAVSDQEARVEPSGGYCSDKRFGYFWATAKVSREDELRKQLHTTAASCAAALKQTTYQLIISTLLIILAQSAIAQDMTVYHKYENDHLLIRWIPVNADDWLNSLYTGYIIERYEEDVLTFRTETPILPQTTDYLRLYNDSLGVRRHMVASLNHIEEVPDSLVQETFPSEDYTPDELEEARLTALNYLLNFDFGLTTFAGLGYRDQTISPNVNYRYVIRRANAPRDDAKNSAEFVFNTATYEEGPLPPLSAEWADRRVELKWPTPTFKDDYFGYQMLRAEGSGELMEMDSVPIMNLYDTSTMAIFQNMAITDILANNDTLYTYHLYGYDYFGGISKNYREVKGKGKVDIGLSPMIHETTQLPTNEVEIEWHMLDKFADKVQEFRLYVAESWDGPYEADTLGIDPSLRTLIRPIPYGGTYFRIAALDFDSLEHSSFPQLVMALDTVAPAIPQGISYEIDSLGILQLQWLPNDEEDFIGYKVFLANDSTDEFSLAHYDFLERPQFVDTVDLISINEYIYYKIISVDTRNNRSEFSDVLTVQKPDILPPVEPNFEKAIPGPGLCLLKWTNSISEDLESQSLYRRIIDLEQTWTEIAYWAGDTIPVQYVDTSLNAELTYAYILTATDDAGLTSEPSEPIAVTPFPDHRKVDLQNYTVTPLPNRQGHQVDILFDVSEVFQVWIYRQYNDEKPRILQKLEPPTISFLDRQLEEEGTYSYFLQVIFDDGVKSVYSPSKSVD